jgi:IS30 family transposase
MLAELPVGQRRVAKALISKDTGCTYPEVAKLLGLHLGTVHCHLRRIRIGRPVIYKALMAERSRQLKERHQRAMERDRAHTQRWFRVDSWFPQNASRRRR